MNKTDFVDRIASKTKQSKKTTEIFLNGMMEVTKEVLKEGEKISLVGFGTFQVMLRKATVGVNPKTKKKIVIPEKRVAKLKFSSSINDLLNQS